MKNCIAEPNDRVEAVLHELVDECDRRHSAFFWWVAIETDSNEVFSANHEVEIEAFIRFSGIYWNDG